MRFLFDCTKRLRTVREHAIAPTPVGAHPRRAALVARRNARKNLGVSLLVTFLFAPAVSKRKVAKGAETRDGGCFIRRIIPQHRMGELCSPDREKEI